MSAKLLENLTSEELAVRLAFVSAHSALRACLQKTREVGELAGALRLGTITEDGIERFVSGLLKDLRIGERFEHEIALAALAAVLETRPTDFAEQFLQDLSRLRLAEMSLCIRVARECLKRRVNIARCQSRVFRLEPDEECVLSVVTSQSPFPENGNTLENTTVTYKVA